ncbi:MAG: hypothetical protein KGK30_06670, partial [Elusimicrobia bacterium]|nr:hypothetical protein [Elusimicrobiota bacterium]
RAGPRRALPANLGQLVDMRILPALPQAMTGLHAPSSAATNYDRRDSAILHDTGGWGYVPATGTVFIDCTHKGPFGRFWYQF